MATATAASFGDLASLIDFLDLNRGKTTDLAKEIGEVQKEFETRFVRSQQQYENLKASLSVRVEASGWQKPVWMAQALEAKLPKVREQQQARRERLRGELQDLEQQRDEIEAQSKADFDKMKQENPRLNEREEDLKQQQTALQAQLAALGKDLQNAAAGLGWLLRVGRIRKVREQYEEVGLKLHGVNERLTEVRQTWRDLAQKSTETEDRLRNAWRLRVAEIARIKAETANLEGDFEQACRSVGVDEILTLLEQPQASDAPEFDQQVADLLTFHQQVRDYENGIVQVSQLMGTLNGLGDGLGRFGESVKGVKQEQDMHTELSDLKLQAPEQVVAYHQLWDQLQPVVLDEKGAAEHPADFAGKLQAVIGERLGSTEIDLMFNNLGNELKRATDEQW